MLRILFEKVINYRLALAKRKFGVRKVGSLSVLDDQNNLTVVVTVHMLNVLQINAFCYHWVIELCTLMFCGHVS